MSGRARIPRRRRIFLGCEGESEQGYGAFLDRLAQDNGHHVHIKAVNLQPAGDPIKLTKKAIDSAKRDARSRGAFEVRAVLLDADRLSATPAMKGQVHDLLAAEEFIIIWQIQDHEAHLLRHFAGHEHDNPPSSQTLARLQAHWPGYRKGMPSSEIRRVLSLDHVKRAAGVTPPLMTLLQRIGFK